MYEAFELIHIVEKLPLKITSLATWGDHFILSAVSSRQETHLLVYIVRESSDYDKIYESKLIKTLKKFTSEPITQLAVVPEHNIFLGLSDGVVFYADLEHFHLLGHLSRSKGASYFAVDWQKLRAHDVEFRSELRICVGTRKKLQLYNYQRSVFVWKADLTFGNNTPCAFAWVEDSLIVCIKKDLYHVTIHGDVKELFQIGAIRTDPCLLPLMNGEILVLKDEMQVSLDSKGKPTVSQPLVWSELPLNIEHFHPYIIGILPRGLEVRALDQKIHVQTIKPPDTIKFITSSSSKTVLVASATQVYKLQPRKYDQQVYQCVQGKQFELALQVAELVHETPDEKEHRKKEILQRFAFHQFTQHRFEESLMNYLQIQEDPVNVIGLYPNLLPSDLQQVTSTLVPGKIPTLTGEDLNEGMKHLIEYLTQVRYKEQQKLTHHHKGEMKLQEETMRKLEEQLSLVETTLLKCYIQTGNSTLIRSLVRLPNNHLHFAESERLLRNNDKFQELVDLCHCKGKHRKALQLISEFSQKCTGALSGVWPIIKYLQNLGRDHIYLILEYSEEMIKTSPDVALSIFTEDQPEVESLPRQQVLDHLASVAPDLTIPYLEHIIGHWGDTTQRFHDKLVQLYQKKVEALLTQYKAKNKGDQQPKAGEEPGELGRLRAKLLKFLGTSRHYDAAECIGSLPRDDLFEERALLLNRLGQHEVVLAIYVHLLKQPEMAEKYCIKNHDPDNEESREVYMHLIKLHLSPPNFTDYDIHLPDGSEPKASVKDAFKVLIAHHDDIDIRKVLELLPAETQLKEIEQFLTTILQERTQMLEHLQLKDSETERQCVSDEERHCEPEIASLQQERDRYRDQVSLLTQQSAQKDNLLQAAEAVQLQLRQQQIQKDQVIQRLQSENKWLKEQKESLHSETEGLRQQIVSLVNDKDGLRQQIVEKDRLIQSLQSEKEGVRQQVATLQQQIQRTALQLQSEQSYQSKFWEVPRKEVSLNMQKILGTGAWGFVVEGMFRGQQVAVKCLHDMIREPYFMAIIRKEIDIMAQIRHPNLVMLIAAVIDAENDPLVVTELLDMSLRKAYERNLLEGSSKLNIFRDIASALNYLHLHHRGEIIHRDVSSANVLLEAKPNKQWKAKLSDFGSAKLVMEAKTTGPGAPVYAAPEVMREIGVRQTAKVDVYSYGILLCEVTMGQFPLEERLPSMIQAIRDRWVLMHGLITACIQEHPDNRPTMSHVLMELNKLRSN